MVTQKDIAESLGVSVALVSRVLSGKAQAIGASKSTIQKIATEAERQGYRPSYHAQALRGAPSRMLGIAVHDFEDPFFGHVIHLLQEYAAAHQFSLMLAGAEDAPYENFLQQPVSRLIILGSSEESAWLNSWAARGVPLTQIGRGPDHPALTCITVDELSGFRELAGHLLKNGARKTAYVGPEKSVRAYRHRAFQQAAEESGLTADHFVKTNGIHMQDGLCSIDQWLAEFSIDELDALVCANDQLAIGVLHGLHKRGVRVPHDLLVTGFDDIPIAQYTHPALTTLRQPMDEMIKLLFSDQMEASNGSSLVLPPTLIVRESA